MPYLVLAILYFVCTAIEIFGIAAAYRASVPLVRAYFWAAATSAVVVSACEVVRTTLHFTKKGEIVAACIDSYSTDVARGTYSNSDVSSFCNDSWRNSSYVSSFSFPGRRHLQQLTHTHTHRSTLPSSSLPFSSPSSSRPSPLHSCISCSTCVLSSQVSNSFRCLLPPG